MSDIIGRLLDEAEKAQRKGHLVLAEVCRDASDQLGLVTNERDGANALIDRMHAQDLLAIQAWQKANPGNDPRWPGSIRLSAWCLGEIANLEAERDQLRAAILDTERHDAGLVPMRLRLLALKETGHD
jgi:hypothetical protein